MESINSLDHLIKALNMRSNDESYLHILSNVNLESSDFRKYFSWNDNYYTRNSLYKSSNYDLVLKCYEINQKTSIQEFTSDGVWVMPILGEIAEELYLLNEGKPRLELLSSTNINSKEYSYKSTDLGIHRFKNSFNGRSASINIHINSSDNCKIYDEHSGNYTTRKITYDTVFSH